MPIIEQDFMNLTQSLDIQAVHLWDGVPGSQFSFCDRFVDQWIPEYHLARSPQQDQDSGPGWGDQLDPVDYSHYLARCNIGSTYHFI